MSRSHRHVQELQACLPRRWVFLPQAGDTCEYGQWVAAAGLGAARLLAPEICVLPPPTCLRATMKID